MASTEVVDKCESTLSKLLLKDLSEQSDIVIDFSSLKTCLNPKGIEEEEIEVAMLCYYRCNLAILLLHFRTSIMKNLYVM